MSFLLLGAGRTTAASGNPTTGFLGAQVYSTAALPTNWTTRTAIPWDTEQFDTNTFHDSGSNTRLTIPSELNGYYVVVLASVAITSISGNSDLYISKNGSLDFDGASGFKTDPGADGSASSVFLQCRTQPIQVSTGDYFEAHLFSESDNNITPVTEQSSFAIYVVGPSITGCLVKNASDLTAQNYSAGGVVNWGSEVYDSSSLHDTGSNTSRITIPAGLNGRTGILKANIRLSSVSLNISPAVFIAKNGSFLTVWLGEGRQLAKSGGGSAAVPVEAESQPIVLSTGDFFEAVISCGDTSVTLDAAASSFSLEVMPVSFQGCVAKINADVTAHNYSTPEDLTFNGADVYDTDALHDPASNNTKIIATSAVNGKYGILYSNINTSLVASSSNNSIVIQKGNTNSYNGFGGRGGSNGAFNNSAVCGRTQIVQLTTGDEFTAQFYCSDTSITLEQESTTFGLRVLPEQ